MAEREDAIRVLKRVCGIEPEAATQILDALRGAGLFVVAADETADKDSQ